MAVGGLDISGASSTSVKAVFLATGLMDIPMMGDSRHNSGGQTDYAFNNIFWLSGLLRIAGMAQPGTLTGNLGDVGSTATYLASAVNSTPDQIVQSVEADATVSYQFNSWQPQVGSFGVGTFSQTADRPHDTTLFTISAILSLGAITPLSPSQANPPVYYLTQQIMSTYSFSPSGCSYSTGVRHAMSRLFRSTERTSIATIKLVSASNFMRETTTNTSIASQVWVTSRSDKMST
jgi:hypothetical protein